ncbi:MAG: CCA tRNA nucleotidyltransferase [Alphaproteobacteria bacterium]|nr:CCA tRNA nucleotidyltransferase [Alphaproteobacteria bacterium]
MKSGYLDMRKIVRSPHIVKLFEAVEEHGGTLRFVGGAVRDTLAGLSGFDLDLATDLSPDELVEACMDFRLKTMPIGLKSDTTGVVIDNQILEVASLKRHVLLDSGRTEEVFTDDWSADAAERDLTINAVYADLRGNVFDYYNGIDDLEHGIVRFIGNAESQIKKDYLRIMRFFRFYSKFAQTPMDKEALEACIKLKDGLRSVAIERVRDELFKLLVTPNVTETLRIIFDNNILGYFLPPSQHLDALWRLTKIVADAQYEGNFLRRLFVLYQPNASEAENIAGVLRFTKKQKETFIKWAKINLDAEHMISPQERLKYVYRYGKQWLIDKILLEIAIRNLHINRLGEVLREIENAVVPIFPLRGRDVAAKINDGAQIGRALAMLEQRWIDSDFTLTRDELLQTLDI